MDSDLLNELERKDLIIKNLQKQLKENLSYFKTDSYYNTANQLKNEIMRKDYEISFLSSKLNSIQVENNKLSKSTLICNRSFSIIN